MTDEKQPDVVTVYEDAAGEFRWRRQDGNNKIVSESGEGYKDRWYAVNVAREKNAGCEIRS